jgi:cytidine deaminase
MHPTELRLWEDSEMTKLPLPDFSPLIAEARAFARPIKPTRKCEAGIVAAVIITATGKRYSGVSMEFTSGMGSCAEHAAVAAMLKDHETVIAHVVAVHHDGRVFPPCGRCREMMWQLDTRNRDALVILSPTLAVPLHELLPHPAYDWTTRGKAR